MRGHAILLNENHHGLYQLPNIRFKSVLSGPLLICSNVCIWNDHIGLGWFWIISTHWVTPEKWVLSRKVSILQPLRWLKYVLPQPLWALTQQCIQVEFNIEVCFHDPQMVALKSKKISLNSGKLWQGHWTYSENCMKVFFTWVQPL